MQRDSLQRFFASSPAVRLLRSPNAAWILDFFHQQFKLAGRITRVHSELVADLDRYLEQLPESSPADATKAKPVGLDKAGAYLAAWCSGSTGWLKRFIDENETEPTYQLTADSEQALAFVSNASHAAGFVGTESRLKAILQILGDVVVGISDDPRSRIEHLERQRAEIDREIASLQSSSAPPPLGETQIRERFSLAVSQLEQLKSDFRSVEDRFKDITRGVQQKVLAASESRGGILQFALDSEDMLKRGDQGQSFFEFLRLIHSPESQDRIAEIIRRLTAVEALAGDHAGLHSLRTMIPTLIAESEKILRTTQHLSVTLRRLLDGRSTRHHQRLAHVLRDVLASATALADHPPEDIGLEVEVELEIQSAMDRPFWSAPEPFTEIALQPAAVDAEGQAAMLEHLASLERLDWQAMRQNITRMTENYGETPIAELLGRFPLQIGAIEILGYLQIAHDDRHRIDRSKSIQLPAPTPDDVDRTLTLPQVTFLPSETRKKRRPAQHTAAVAVEEIR